MAYEDDGWMQGAFKVSQGNLYLGDYKVVDSLLRTFVGTVIDMDPDEMRVPVEKGARALARVFLGQDDRYQAMAWNSPGQIAPFLAKWGGTASDDPEEMVAGAAVNLFVEPLTLKEKVLAEKLLQEQWGGAAHEIVGKYVKMFLGIPPGWSTGERGTPSGPKNRLRS